MGRRGGSSWSRSEYLARSSGPRPNQQEQFAAAEVRKSEQALDRYFNAFETGKMDEISAGPGRGPDREAQRASHPLFGIDRRHRARGANRTERRETAALRARIRRAIEHGRVTLRKAVLQEWVPEVRVETWRKIRPTLRLPLHGVS
jgi:hypothetical protein